MCDNYNKGKEMLEYGIKEITTNPTLITKTQDIIKLVDSRSNQTRAFVLPNSYAPLIEKLSKELEAKKWAKEKKKLLQNNDLSDDALEDIMQYGIKTIVEYLGEI